MFDAGVPGIAYSTGNTGSPDERDIVTHEYFSLPVASAIEPVSDSMAAPQRFLSLTEPRLHVGSLPLGSFSIDPEVSRRIITFGAGLETSIVPACACAARGTRPTTSTAAGAS